MGKKIAILSDIHANLLALEACLKDAEREQVDQLLSLGDLVGYGPQPEEVVRLVSALDIKSVMGNHDYAVNAVRAEKWFNPQARTVVALTRRLLSEESLEFLKGLPLTMTTNGALLVHGFPPNSFKTYLYMVPERGIKRVLSSLEQDIVLVGHTHELFSYRLKPTGELRVKPLVDGTIALYPGERYIINAGSVGQPRDGDPRAKYLILDLDNRELTTKFIQYDWMRVARMIIERGFPETYAKRLLGRRP